MLKTIGKIGMVVIMVGFLAQPAWSINASDDVNNKPVVISHKGNGAGDGTGNGGAGPLDGTGFGPGDCSGDVIKANAFQVVKARKNAGSGNNGGYGPGDGTGNGGDGPKDGTGNGPGGC